MRMDMTRDECRKCLRCLELEAYGSMVSVLRAQGPLTDDKKKLLAELAKVLHISNERHRAEVRRAVNDDKLSIIADQLNGPNTWTDWAIEGRRTIPLLPRLKAHTAFTGLANSLSLVIAAANENKIPLDDKSTEVKVPKLSPAKTRERNRRKSSCDNSTVLGSASDVNNQGSVNDNEVNCFGSLTLMAGEVIEKSNESSSSGRKELRQTINNINSNSRKMKVRKRTCQWNSENTIRNRCLTAINDDLDEVKSLDSVEIHCQERFSPEENSRQSFDSENSDIIEEKRKTDENPKIRKEKLQNIDENKIKSINQVQNIFDTETLRENDLQCQENFTKNKAEAINKKTSGNNEDKNENVALIKAYGHRNSVEKSERNEKSSLFTMNFDEIEEEENDMIEGEFVDLEQRNIAYSENDFSHFPDALQSCTNLEQEKKRNTSEIENNSTEFETVSSSSLDEGYACKKSKETNDFHGKLEKFADFKEIPPTIKTISPKYSENDAKSRKFNRKSFDFKKQSTINNDSLRRKLKRTHNFERKLDKIGDVHEKYKKIESVPGKGEKIAICLKKSSKTGDFSIKPRNNDDHEKNSDKTENSVGTLNRIEYFPAKSEKIAICLKKSAKTGDFSIKMKTNENFEDKLEKNEYFAKKKLNPEYFTKKLLKSPDFSKKSQMSFEKSLRAPDSSKTSKNIKEFDKKLVKTGDFSKKSYGNSHFLKTGADSYDEKRTITEKSTKTEESSQKTSPPIEKLSKKSKKNDNFSENNEDSSKKRSNSLRNPKNSGNLKLKLLNHTQTINLMSTPSVNLETLQKSLSTANVIVVNKGVKLSRENLSKFILDDKKLTLSGKNVVFLPHRTLAKLSDTNLETEIINSNIASKNITNSLVETEECLENHFNGQENDAWHLENNEILNNWILNEAPEEIENGEMLNMQVASEDLMQDVEVHAMENEEVLMDEIEQSSDVGADENYTEDCLEEEETIEISQEPICNEILIEQDANTVIIDAQSEIYNFKPTDENVCEIQIDESIPTVTNEEIYASDDIVVENYAYEEETVTSNEEENQLNQLDS